MVKDKDVAFHAKNINTFSIGIEVEARGKEQPRGVLVKIDVGLTSAQNNALVTLVKQLREKYGIPLNNIVPHRDDWGSGSGVGTFCPQILFDTQKEFEEWRSLNFS